MGRKLGREESKLELEWKWREIMYKKEQYRTRKQEHISGWELTMEIYNMLCLSYYH